MTDTPAPDYKDTVFLPKTDFPMKAGLSAKEPAILARWEKLGLYDRLREQRAGRERFILHDGPPYANGDIHMGHAMNKVLKDIVVRSQSLLGKDAPYVPGWDCHGLPIEWKVEEAYRAKRLSKDDVPVAQFRAECRAYAEKWVAVQRPQFERLGVMGDWADPYLTMKYDAEAAIVGELLKFAESGQLYRGAKPVMWSPVEKTALAEAEVEYEDVVSTQIDVAFEILEAPNAPELQKLIDSGKKVAAVIWTTTPWTIPVNQALSYGPEIEYVLWPEAVGDARLIGRGSDMPMASVRYLLIAEHLLLQFLDRTNLGTMRPSSAGLEWFGDPVRPFRWSGKGSQLAGATARHPMYNHLRHPGESRGPASSTDGGEGSGTPGQARGDEREGALAFFAKPRPFLPGDFVTTDAGTGLVHMAPDHGEDDFLLCKQYGIDPVFAVDGAGMYRDDWAWRGGQGSVINKTFVAADGPICTDLQAAGALLAASDDFAHSYPHSWRSKAKVIFRATPQWFIPMDRSATGSPSRLREGLGEGMSADVAADPTAPPPTPPASGRGAEEGNPMDRSATESPSRLREGLGEGMSADVAADPTAPPPTRPASGRGAEEGNPMDRSATGSPSRLREGSGEGMSADVATDVTAPPPTPPASGRGEGEGNAATLREIALDSIARTRWVPARAENRITAMVSQRPDWVISRQRAWGVPIALYVHRTSGQYLNDARVNARIVAAFREGGADAWFAADHQALLGEQYRAEDYEVVTDILDVWFDSGSTHAFVIEARYGEGTRANLYLEGSDQHRGWFQSSLLESSGTRGRAPYDAVLTHGFALDGNGRKMSKSLGNVVDPLKIIADSGADILRLWVAQTDYFEDVKIGREVLGTTADAYRKLRNTFRYLLGSLDGFEESERIAPGEMPELERYMLHQLHVLDGGLRSAADEYAFNRYLRLLTDFAAEDLSAFYFDIRKDSLYCDAPTGLKRRACRTVMDVLFHALVRYAAPILVFTTEEVWQARFPSEDGSVHFLEWPELPDAPPVDLAAWHAVRAQRAAVTEAIEPLRREKVVRSSLEAEVTVPDAAMEAGDLAELFIVAQVAVGDALAVVRSEFCKCGRCWRLLPEVEQDGALCGRCSEVLA